MAFPFAFPSLERLAGRRAAEARRLLSLAALSTECGQFFLGLTTALDSKSLHLRIKMVASPPYPTAIEIRISKHSFSDVTLIVVRARCRVF